MKSTQFARFIAGLLLFSAARLLGADQPFKSGSNGSYGPIDITVDTTLDMPPDGIFHCTTIRIGPGTLRFKKNALNTPVYLLATGDVLIEGSGWVDVSAESPQGTAGGRGGPGGFDGGHAAFQGAGYGDGQGPGRGIGNSTAYAAVFAAPSTDNTNAYGNSLLIPLIGGSGSGSLFSGGAQSGGGGGGAILIASDTKVTISGIIISSGTLQGSAGAIRVVAPIIAGAGGVYAVNSRTAYNERGVISQPGWIRLDSLDRVSYRSLTLAGRWSRGSAMVIFPPNQPRLDIIEAAGTPIAVGAALPVDVKLNVGSPETQTVKVQGTNSTNDVPITVSITPENGPSSRYDATIAKPVTGNTSVVSVEVKIPLDTVCHVHVWTR